MKTGINNKTIESIVETKQNKLIDNSYISISTNETDSINNSDKKKEYIEFGKVRLLVVEDSRNLSEQEKKLEDFICNSLKKAELPEDLIKESNEAYGENLTIDDFI